MADFYSTVAAVKARTGVEAHDLGMDDEAELDTFITDLLKEISELVNRQMRKSYLTEATIPAGLNGVVADIASDSLREMVATRQTPVVRIDDFAVRVIQTRMLSPDIKVRLRLYSAGRGVVSVDVGQPDISELYETDIDTAVFLEDPGWN